MPASNNGQGYTHGRSRSHPSHVASGGGDGSDCVKRAARRVDLINPLIVWARQCGDLRSMCNPTDYLSVSTPRHWCSGAGSSVTDLPFPAEERRPFAGAEVRRIRAGEPGRTLRSDCDLKENASRLEAAQQSPALSYRIAQVIKCNLEELIGTSQADDPRIRPRVTSRAPRRAPFPPPRRPITGTRVAESTLLPHRTIPIGIPRAIQRLASVPLRHRTLEIDRRFSLVSANVPKYKNGTDKA